MIAMVGSLAVEQGGGRFGTAVVVPRVSNDNRAAPSTSLVKTRTRPSRISARKRGRSRRNCHLTCSARLTGSDTSRR